MIINIAIMVTYKAMYKIVIYPIIRLIIIVIILIIVIVMQFWAIAREIKMGIMHKNMIITAFLAIIQI
jgi:hypothetical protein